MIQRGKKTNNITLESDSHVNLLDKIQELEAIIKQKEMMINNNTSIMQMLNSKLQH